MKSQWYWLPYVPLHFLQQVSLFTGTAYMNEGSNLAFPSNNIVDFSSLRFVGSTSKLLVNEPTTNFIEASRSEASFPREHPEAAPKIPEKVSSKCRKRKTPITDDSLENQKDSTSGQENEAGRSTRLPRKRKNGCELVDESEEEANVDGVSHTNVLGQWVVVVVVGVLWRKENLAMEEENIHHANHGYLLHEARICSVFLSKMVELPRKAGSPVRASIIFFLILLICAFISLHWIDVVPPVISGTSLQKTILPSNSSDTYLLGINCSITCPTHSSATIKSDESSSSGMCPEYFRWIHQDLNPWMEKGITKEMVENAGSKAYIRIVIVNGRVYWKKLKWVYQTRDVFNIWGILQLLRLYPGKLPDLDIMFECGDQPVIQKSDYGGSNANNVTPMFHYCGSDSTFDIVFPDWSFWGWPEIHIKPWEALRKDLEEGNKRVKWIDRIPYAYWKGNPGVGLVRNELLKCNLTDRHDWGALIYDLNWELARKERYKSTDLAEQCTHRSLLPSIHYWPINENNMCKSIKSAVNWGNKHPQKVQEIGKAGSKFIQEELKMKNVYDYMFHLLYGYGKLLKYKPTVPEGSVEVCLETMACSGPELEKTFKMSSMVSGPANTSPCTMPPPYDPTTLQSFLERKSNLAKQVERWEASENR
ncbi:unnamed protein product [Camellia sinensis]